MVFWGKQPARARAFLSRIRGGFVLADMLASTLVNDGDRAVVRTSLNSAL